MTTNQCALKQWVDEVAKLRKPDKIYWCDGSRPRTVPDRCNGQQRRSHQAQRKNPYQLLSDRSNPTDVARGEHLTFVCTNRKGGRRPKTIAMEPQEANTKIDALFKGAQRVAPSVTVLHGPASTLHFTLPG